MMGDTLLMYPRLYGGGATTSNYYVTYGRNEKTLTTQS